MKNIAAAFWLVGFMLDNTLNRWVGLSNGLEPLKIESATQALVFMALWLLPAIWLKRGGT